MAAEWETVELGEVATLDIDRVAVQPDEEYRLVGVLIAGQGLFWRDTIRGRETNYPELLRLREGQLVMRKLTAWEGPITTVPPEFDGGYVSSEFPTFRLDKTRLLPGYMRLICQRPSLHAEMRMRSTGTAERRNRLKPGDLLSIEVDLPPLAEQRAIAEVVDATGALEAAYGHEAKAAAAALSAARDHLLRRLKLRRLGDLVMDIQGGKSPKALDRPPNDREPGVLKVSSIRPAQFRPEEAKAAPGAVFPPHARVRSGDVLVSRANTRLLVGATCRVRGDFGELYLSDKTLRVILDDTSLDGDFLVHALASTAARVQIELAAGGTSDSMKNISQKAILDLNIPYVEDLAAQRGIAGELGTLADAARTAVQLSRTMRRVQTSLLESLLSGERRVDAPDLATA